MPDETPVQIKNPSYFGFDEGLDFSKILSTNATEEDIDKFVGNVNTRAVEKFVPNNYDDKTIQATEKSIGWAYDYASPNQLLDWSRKGEINSMEAFKRMNKWELMPYLNVGTLAEDVPMITLLRKSEKNPELLSSEENVKIKEFYNDMAEISVRGYSFGASVTQGVMMSVPFMVEFITSGGLMSAGKAVGKKGAQETIEAGAKGIAKKMLKESAIRTALSPHRVVKGYYDRRINDGINLTRTGELFYKEAEENPSMTVLKAVGDQWVEQFSEIAGDNVFGGIGNALKKKLPKNFGKMFTSFATKETGDRVSNLIAKTGFNGLLEELGEERLGSFMRAALNIDDDEEYSLAGIVKAIGYKSFDDFGIELGTISGAGGMSLVAANGLNRAYKRLEKQGKMKDVDKGEFVENFMKMDEVQRQSLLQKVEATETEEDAKEYRELFTDFSSMVGQSIPKEQLSTNMALIDNMVTVFAGQTGTKRKDVMLKTPSITTSSQDGAGAYNPKSNMITILKSANESTFIHEMSHWNLEMYLRNKPDLLEPLFEWAGVKKNDTGELSNSEYIKLHESFARGFEAYLMEGKAPNKKLAKVFNQFRQWLLNIYKNLGGLARVSGRKINLNDDIMNLFDSLVDVDQEVDIDTSMVAEEVRDRDITLYQEAQKQIEELKKKLKKVTDKIDIDKANKQIERLQNKQRDITDRAIQRNLKFSKDVKQAGKIVGKYNYETNKHFEKLREYNKLTAGEAFDALFKLEPTNKQERMEKAFLEYKTRGKRYGSPALYKQVLDDILEAKAIGKEAKNEADFFKRLNRAEKAGKIESAIKNIKGTKDSFKNKMFKAYAKGFGSVYSILNVVGGKSIAEEFDPEIYENRYNTAVFNKTVSISKEAAKVFGLKNARDLSTVVNNLANNVDNQYEITDKDGITKDISKMELIDIYNSIKNDQIRERYYNTFGQEQIDTLLSNLSAQEQQFGDIMQRNLEDYYDSLSDVYVKLYGKDLSKVKKYWPSSSEHQSDVDIFNDYIGTGITPSSFKERVKGKIEPKPTNAWFKSMRHVAQSEHILNLGLEYKSLKEVFADKRVKDAVEKKFGKDMLDLLNKQLDTLSLSSKSEKLDAISGLFGRMTNNWVVAKIGIPNPGVPLKQLISMGNYIEVMPAMEWGKYFTEGVANPKKTWDFMMENAEFLEARFKRGSTEAVNRVMDEASKMSKVKHDWTQFMTLATRSGDIIAIIFGGYPVVQHHLSQGKSMKEAIEIFEKATLKAQQSGNASALSDFQNSQTPLTKLFLAFKNTPTQYLRKLAESNMEFFRGDIDAGQYAKTMAIYAIIQPALFGFMGTLSRALFFGGDDEDYMSDMMDALALNPFNAVPLIDGISRWSLRKATGRKPYEAFQFPVFSDVSQAFRKLKKQDIDAFDVLGVIAKPIGELGFSVPVGTFERFYKGWVD